MELPGAITESAMRFARIEVPVSEQQKEALIDFWCGIFDPGDVDFHEIYAGQEAQHNRDIIYLAREGGRVVGTCRLTISRACPWLAGLGGVATAPQYRGRGIAARLCAWARDDFRDQNGVAVFLGTANPAAARVYARVGWRRLPGTEVMALITDGSSPEAFLLDHFRREYRSVSVTRGSPCARIPMIPLIVSPHDWQVMDAQVNIFSTRHACQRSCMGLYPRYQRLAARGGLWFAAETDDHRTVALATARMDEDGAGQIDGFAHANFPSARAAVIRTAIEWTTEMGTDKVWARLSEEDEEKQRFFESLGFHKVGRAESFTLDGRQVGAVRFELNDYTG